MGLFLWKNEMAIPTDQQFDDAARDLVTVDDVANSPEDTTTTRSGDTVLTLTGAINKMAVSAGKPFDTEADLLATPIPDPPYIAEVLHDPDPDKNGRYSPVAGAWVKSVDTVSSRIRHDGADQQMTVQDPDASNMLSMDDKGHLYVTKSEGKSVQQIIQGLKNEIRQLKKEKTSEFQYGPYFSIMTNAQKAAFQMIDANAKFYLSGTNSRPLDEMLNRFQKHIEKLYKYDLIVDVVKDAGLKGNGKNPEDNEINALIAKMKKKYNGGALYMPGDWLLSYGILPQSNIHFIGAGYGVTRFFPMRNRPAFYTPDNSGWLENCLFQDIEISGEMHSEQNVACKGFFIRQFQRCMFMRNYIHDTGATGMGSDFVNGSSILDGRYENNGRLGSVGDPGNAGIGVGSGVGQDEPTLIIGNICTGNKNYGIFFEQQRTEASVHQSRQIIVANNICLRNHDGIGDCGLSGAIFTGNQLNDNINAGFAADSGTLNPDSQGRPQPGHGGVFANNQVLRNGQHGVLYDAQKVATPGGYKFDGNRIAHNGGAGITLTAGVNMVPDQWIANNDIVDNQGAGVHIESGVYPDLDITMNRFLRNNGIAVRAGASAIVLSGRMFANSVRDTQETPTQLQMFAGTAAISKFDVSNNQFIGPNPSSAIDIPNADASVTVSNNPGISTNPGV